MSLHVKTALIGGGVMGEAIARSLLRSGTPKELLTVAEPNADRKPVFDALGVGFTSHNLEAARGAEVIVLSIKPQTMRHVLGEFPGEVAPHALIFSIMAGVPIGSMAKYLGDHQPIVRVMPNTPAQIGEGISGWTCTPSASAEQRKQAEAILSAMGEHVFFEDEHYLDMVTALSGTGPAYVFLFMEAMIDAGVHMGFPRRIAEQLVVQTLKGSVEYYDHNHEHPASLRNEVTSPGGTSAEALYYLEKAGFRTAISRAIWAAYQRSKELGEGRNKQNLEG